MSKSILLDGRYSIENLDDSIIGEDGMGKVYLGNETDNGLQVAIKTLHAEKFNGNPEVLERFQREGELL